MSGGAGVVLTATQTDALEELINISFARTGAALSELTRERVSLQVPHIVMCSMADLPAQLGEFVNGDVATVHQIFSGAMSGDALLILGYDSAVNLSGLISDVPNALQRLDASEREVLMEVGSILLNACLGMFGNLLKIHISFSVPRMHMEALDTMLSSLTVNAGELKYALVATTGFHLRNSAIEGSLVFVLGVDSLERLLQTVESLG